MVMKEDKQRLRKVLLDAISLLCKNGLPVETEFCIEATIGITLNEDDVVLVSFKEIIKPDKIPSTRSSSVRADLHQRQLPDDNKLSRIESVAENHNGNVDNETNNISTNMIDEIKTNNDAELICEESKAEYEPFRVPEVTQKSEIRVRKRQFDHHMNRSLDGMVVNTDNAVVSEGQYRRTFRHSLPGQPKLRRKLTVREDCVSDALVTIKEETLNTIDNDYVKRENEHAEWSGDADDDSWMFQEVYESEGLSYNTSSYTSDSRQSSNMTRQMMQDSDRLPGRMCKTDQSLQSWSSPDVTQTDEGLGRRQGSSTYRTASSLDQNIVAHTNWTTAGQPLNLVKSKRDFACETCGSLFKHKCSLKAHLKNHVTPFRHKCMICERSFADRSTLSKHTRIHTGEKPYECCQCQQKFAQSGNLKRHERNFHRTTDNHFLTH